MEYKCPNCEEPIDYVETRQDCVERGSYNIESGNFETDETTSYDNLEYFCPHCGEEIEDPNDLEKIDEDLEEKKEEELIKIDIKNKLITTQINPPSLQVIICKECNEVVDYIWGEKEVQCPNCNLINKIK